MDIIELTEISPEDFDIELGEKLGDKLAFAEFLRPAVIDQTIEWLNNRIDSVDSQLARYSSGPGSDPDWVNRTNGFRRLLVSRLNSAKRRVHANTPAARNERNWKEFAHKLAGVIQNLENEVGEVWPELDDITAPYGDISAREWLKRRMEKDPRRVLVAA